MKSMQIKKEQIPVIITHIVGLAFFSQYFIGPETERFLIYCGVVAIGILILAFTNKKANYHTSILWALTGSFFLHVAGNAIPINGDRLYDLIVLPISDTWPIIRYDQIVHMYGLFVMTFIIFHFLKPFLEDGKEKWPNITFIIFLGALGVGSINETVEFLLKANFPEKIEIGEFINTSLDLISNTIGAALATIVIWLKHRSRRNSA